jgi:Arc/MetJ-type ribon-helix-helix transcriptional regulator
MTKLKIAVSLPRPLVEHARRAVAKGRAKSVSAYIAVALQEKAEADDLGAMLDGMLEENGGPPTAAEVREADKVLGISRKKRRAA